MAHIATANLRTLLKRLRLPPSAHIPQSSRATNTALSVDAYLTQLVRQGYLERTRTGSGPKHGRAPGPTQAAAGEDGEGWEWRWGARALCEVGEVAVARFVAEFMVDRPAAQDGDGEDGEGEEGGRDGAGRAKRLETMLKGIERGAAGGPLLDIKSA